MRWGTGVSNCGHAHLTLPSLRDGPLPLPPEGRRGAAFTSFVRRGDHRASACICCRRSARPGRSPVGWPVAPHRAAVDKDVLDTGSGGHRRFEGRAVGDGRRVEDGDVGKGAGGERAAAGQAELGGGKTGHATHGFLQAKKPEIAAVMAENPREGAPQPRMRVGIVW